MLPTKNDLEPAKECCPICGSMKPTKRLFKLQDDLYLSKCLECHAASADRMPNNTYLESLYDPRHYSSSLTSHSDLSSKCAKNIIANFAINGRKKISILDYGGGNGSLAKSVVELLKSSINGHIKISATVVDIFPKENTNLIEFISVDDFLEANERYDIIIASAVLEHIPNLKPIIEKLFQVGTENALLYARTPYEAPLVKLLPIINIKWPRHVHDMGPDFWETFIEKYNANIIHSQTSIVETTFKSNFPITLAAYILKFPSFLETKYLKKILKYNGNIWKFVGGWEVFVSLKKYENI